MPAVHAWARLQVSWTGLIVTLITLAAFVFLRRLVADDDRRRGQAALWILVLSLALRLPAMAAAAAGAHTAAGILNFVCTVSLAFGVTTTAGMIVFDLALGRLGARVPAILRDLIQAIAFVVILMGILRGSGVNLLSLVTTSAVLTAVIGLALQSTIANLFAGLSLQLDRTLSIGDWIQVGGRVGRIHQINLRSTAMITRDGDTAIVPNSQLLTTEVLNYSKPTGVHRVVFDVGFAYRHPPNDVRRVLLDAVRGAPGVLDAPAPAVHPVAFGDSAVIYSVRYWIDEFGAEFPIDGEVKARVWYAAQRAGLEIPFPQRTVQMTEITADRLTAEQEAEFLERMAALARIDLFAPLAPPDRELLARDIRKVGFARDELIIRQGEPGDSMYFIHQGAVAVRLAVDGATREVATLRPGDFFGEMSLMTGAPRTATCAAVSDASCYVISYAAFRRLLENRPKVAEDISSILGNRQAARAGERAGLSAEARARKAADASSDLLARIRGFFNLR